MADDLGRMLHQAAIFNNTDLMASLLMAPELETVDMLDNLGRTPLYTSVTNNSFDCAELLLKAGADANLACGIKCGGMTPLHAASVEDRANLVRLLLDNGADLNQVDASGDLPGGIQSAGLSYGGFWAQKKLVAVCVHGPSKLDTMKNLVQLEESEKKKRDLEKEFIAACESGNCDRARELLVLPNFSSSDIECLVNCELDNGHSLLYSVCTQGNAEVCSLLVEHGAVVKVDGKTGVSPLHIACVYKHASCVELLMRHRPDLLNTPTQDGDHPLHLACMSGDVAVIMCLIDTVRDRAPAADLDDDTGTGEHTNAETIDQSDRRQLYVKKLLQVMNVPDARNQTPLHVAVINNRVDAVRALLTVTLPADAVRNSRPTTIRPAKRSSNNEIVVDVNAATIEGCTALYLAVVGNGLQSFTDIVALLLQAGADPNVSVTTSTVHGRNSVSALGVACERADLVTVELLLRHGACDTGLTIIKSAITSGKDVVVGILLQYHHTMTDTKFRVNQVALASGQYFFEQQHETESVFLSVSSTPSNTALNAIFVDWHKIGLNYLQETWLYSSSLAHVRRMFAPGVVPDWLHANGGRFSSYVITKVDISGNSLVELPAFLFQLPSLRVLVASENKISAIGDPSYEETLIVETSPFSANFQSDENKINCPVLEDIDINRNCLKSIPSWLFTQLHSIRRIDVSHNCIERLEHFVWLCSSLVELNLSHNCLTTIPVAYRDISDFSSSSELDGSVRPSTPQSDNASETNSISGLSHLSFSKGQDFLDIPVTHAERWRNHVKVKMASFDSEEFDASGRPKRRSLLKELDLSHNFLSDTPPVLACVAPSLERLYLANNQFRSMGSLDIYPVNLLVLDLSFNNISTNDGLEAAYVCRTCQSPFQPRSTPPASFHPMRSWSPLHSSSGPSSMQTTLAAVVVCPHRQHTQLERLRSLRLDHNILCRFVVSTADENQQVAALSSSSPNTDVKNQGSRPVNIPQTANNRPRRSLQSSDDGNPINSTVRFFPNLTLLDLSDNKLTSLSRHIADLSNLAELKIANNKIEQLPTELGLMKKLWFLDFTGCPVEELLRCLLGEKAKKTVSVLGYLKSLRDEPTPFNHVKLMFVGIQGIGKTSLLSQLRREEKTNNNNTSIWLQRMYDQKSKDKDVAGKTISTVGVDIGDLVIERNGQKVVFHTWDFGGQQEYYATHQYFLTKRSLYLVVWRLTDGEKGVNEMLKWLISIQARAPNSPVIIVGTHLDAVKRKMPENYLRDVTALIRQRYIVNEPDKKGLPRVLDHIEVSCRGNFTDRGSIRSLAQLIWKVISEETLPEFYEEEENDDADAEIKGNAGRLLEQKVPLSYIRLQQVVSIIARERSELKKDPVLYGGQYKTLVIEKMEELYHTSFQDAAELTHATQFLHENGILLHYEDVSLQNFYFLDPQWLCDMLAFVITIPDINRVARKGVMKKDDMKWLFRGIKQQMDDDVPSYIINLLQKFEVVLLWDNENLIVPSLLPNDCDLKVSPSSVPASDSSSPKRAPARISVRPKTLSESLPKFPLHPRNGQVMPPAPSASNSSQEQPDKRLEASSAGVPDITGLPNIAVSIVRLYVMSYFPCGFWPRLITRLLGDATLGNLAKSLYDDDVITSVFSAGRSGGLPATPTSLKSFLSWRSWQNGVQLCICDKVTVLRIAEIPLDSDSSVYRWAQLMIPKEQDHCWPVSASDIKLNPNDCWMPVDIQDMSVLEIYVPNETISVGGRAFYPKVDVAAALMSHAVDRIDTLLEDWYPDIGARFAQNTRGMYLITRLVPCMHCLLALENSQRRAEEDPNQQWSLVVVPSPQNCFQTVLRPVEVENKSEEDADCAGSTEDLSSEVVCSTVYCFLIEQCIRLVLAGKVIACRSHGIIGPYLMASTDGLIHSAHVAPDLVFQDIGDQRLISSEAIVRGVFLGKGAFGAVYSGHVIDKETDQLIPVALKMLQPVKPSLSASLGQHQMFEIESQKWKKDSMKNSCDAYLNARKELGILLAIKHEHIVPLVGVSISPLCLILSLAPEGSLSNHLRNYLRAGYRLASHVIRDIIVQVASAISYLHSMQIIYRDLKSENVLVWSLPSPGASNSQPVDVKLADYGVSRVVLPTGTKGFAGTPSFMAPEIIQHNGEEPYTEKVDCFSFGMFIYELIMLKIPYEGTATFAGSNINIRGHVLAGGRPPITNKELVYPANILDLMSVCWSRDPDDRPSGREIVEIASRSEFCLLQSVVVADDVDSAICACAVTTQNPSVLMSGYSASDCSYCDVLLSVATSASETGSLQIYSYCEQDCVQIKQLKVNFDGPVTALCATNSDIWCAVEGSPNITVLSPTENYVYIVLDRGHFVVCDAGNVNDQPGYTPVKTECPGNDRTIHCIAIRDSGESSTELWCGQDKGTVSVWNLHSTHGKLHTLNHSSCYDVWNIVNGPSPPSGPCLVWSYVYPGTVITGWNAVLKSMHCQIDLLQCIPSSLIGITEGSDLDKLKVTRCQVKCLSAIGDRLYVGTTYGCLVAIDPCSKSATSVCRPYCASDLSIILALSPQSQLSSTDLDSSSNPDLSLDEDVGEEMDETAVAVRRQRFLLTVGRGYIDLVSSFFSRWKTPTASPSDQFSETSSKIAMVSWSGYDAVANYVGNCSAKF